MLYDTSIIQDDGIYDIKINALASSVKGLCRAYTQCPYPECSLQGCSDTCAIKLFEILNATVQ